MNLRTTLHLLLGLAIVLCFQACSDTPIKTEYTHAIPANAEEVAVVHLKTLVEKAGLADDSHRQEKQKLLALLSNGGNADFVQQMESLINNPDETGIDWDMPVYYFNAPTLRTPAFVAKVNDLPKLRNLFKALAEENICTDISEGDGYGTVEIKESGLLLAFNDGTLLTVCTDSPAQVRKLHPAIKNLMQQGADQCIRNHPHYDAMMQQNGDIRLLATPDVIPFNLRGVLNWPQGTPILGYLLFENGRIYASVQRADFSGETGESAQPFHPQNSKELQQAMRRMMNGHSFNIELTTEELLTLTNLRVIMEFTPDEPEVNAMYLLVQKIETLNARGDNNRTRFTVILHEKNANSLKQLMEFAKQFAGFQL
ncbi:MAG: DUF4836 family protein [Bacteroides sp.]|nr:DUF4836 family protein [Bacteroides sp.]